MEIISFEKRTFEEIAAKLDRFVQRVENLCREHGLITALTMWSE